MYVELVWSLIGRFKHSIAREGEKRTLYDDIGALKCSRSFCRLFSSYLMVLKKSIMYYGLRLMGFKILQMF